MSDRQSAGQSPPPERQAPKQQREPPSSGHGVNTDSKSKDESKSQIEVCLYIDVLAAVSSWKFYDDTDSNAAN
jgi:hypothetical protein